jgi:hypothetical protein
MSPRSARCTILKLCRLPGDYVLTGLLRFALRALACKSRACRPWQARSPGQGSPGALAPLRLTHPRTTGSLCSPKDTRRERTDALQCARSGAAPGTVRLKGTERKGPPDFRARRHLCRECRDAQERPAPQKPGSPRSSVGLEGSPKALSSRPLSLRRSKARGSPSVVRPLAGAGIHRIPAYFRLAPVPAANAGLAALRSPCSRLQVRGSPSVASSFRGTISSLRTPCCAWAPAQALPGLGVRRDERPPDPRLYPAHPPDLCLDPLHPCPATSCLRFALPPPSA